MGRLATLELFKERMGFSAGHFTIFSATSREQLHGHNYQLHVALTTEVVEEYGLTFDYRDYKNILYQRCKDLNETFILPKFSPHLKLSEDADYIYALFDGKKIPFLKEDVTILPVTNVTVEELSFWFLKIFTEDKANLVKNKIKHIEVKISSSPGQFGSAVWESTNGVLKNK